MHGWLPTLRTLECCRNREANGSGLPEAEFESVIAQSSAPPGPGPRMASLRKAWEVDTRQYVPDLGDVPPEFQSFTLLRPPPGATTAGGGGGGGGTGEASGSPLRSFAFQTDPVLRIIPNFLSEADVEHFLGLASEPHTCAPLAFWHGGDPSCGPLAVRLQHAQTEVVHRIEQQVASFFGGTPDCVERLTLVRYAPGEAREQRHAGRHRSHSLMVFLNDVEQGGELRFSRMGVEVPAMKGCAVVWPNLAADIWSSPDWRTIHEDLAAPVANKCVLECYFRPRAPDDRQHVWPGYERIGTPLREWWSFDSSCRFHSSLSIRELAKVHLPAHRGSGKGTGNASTAEERAAAVMLGVKRSPWLSALPDFLSEDEVQSVLHAAKAAAGADCWETLEFSAHQSNAQSVGLQALLDAAAAAAPPCTSEAAAQPAAPLAGFAQAVGERAARCFGADADIVEDVRIERYLPGQFTLDRHAGAHRAYTIVIYLGDEVLPGDVAPEEPPATEFRGMLLRVQHMQGAALVWCNLAPDGRVDPRLRQTEWPASSPRLFIVCHLRAAQGNNALGPLVPGMPHWSVLPPLKAGDPARAIVGAGADYETPEDTFPACPWSFRAPYEALLEFLLAGGWLNNLPADGEGVVRISVPFCAGFYECPVLAAFLASHVLPNAHVSEVAILASELGEQWELAGYWRQKEKYVSRRHPGVKLRVQRMDLAQQALPPCSLALALHPEATKGGPWPAVLANVLRSAAAGNGLCVFTTFSAGELAEVRAACQAAGAECDVHENPHWHQHPLPLPRPPPRSLPPLQLESPSPFARFIILAKGPPAEKVREIALQKAHYAEHSRPEGSVEHV